MSQKDSKGKKASAAKEKKKVKQVRVPSKLTLVDNFVTASAALSICEGRR